MRDTAGEVLWFLTLSSAQIAVAAFIAAVGLRFVRGTAARALVGLVLLVPVLSLAAGLRPEAATVPVPAPVFESVRGPEVFAVTEAEPVATNRASFDWRLALLALWGVAVTILTLRWLLDWVCLRRMLARASVVRAGTPRLLTHPDCRTPFLAGLFDPVIVIPPRLLEPSGARGLRFAILHEMAHFKRRDPWRIPPEMLLRTLYFFHPLVSWALRRVHEEREIQCDREVIAATGDGPGYATFLLDECQRLDRGLRAHPAMRLGRARSTLARRIHRIVSKENQTMSGKLRGILTVAFAFGALATVLAFGPAAARAQDTEAKIDHINARPTGQAGVYFVSPVFEKLTKVVVFNRHAPRDSRELGRGDGYSFDRDTGYLNLRIAVDDKKRMVTVHGVRAQPWQWRTIAPIDAASVRFRFRDRDDGVRSVDFETDGRRIRLLKPELAEARYYLTYTLNEDPAAPDRARHIVIGNWNPRSKKTATPAATPKFKPGMVGTNATATDNPRVFVITQPMDSDSIRVALSIRGKAGDLRWLTRGEDYSYDESDGRIVLLREITVDESRYLFVHGIPKDPSLHLLHRPLKKGEVSVIIGGRTLVEGEGFTVDYEKGIVRVLDPAVRDREVKYRVRAGSFSFGRG